MMKWGRGGKVKENSRYNCFFIRKMAAAAHFPSPASVSDLVKVGQSVPTTYAQTFILSILSTYVPWLGRNTRKLFFVIGP